MFGVLFWSFWLLSLLVRSLILVCIMSIICFCVILVLVLVGVMVYGVIVVWSVVEVISFVWCFVLLIMRFILIICVSVSYGWLIGVFVIFIFVWRLSVGR